MLESHCQTKPSFTGDDKESARSKLNVPLYFTYMADKYPETYKVPTVQKVLSAIEAMQESHGAKANGKNSTRNSVAFLSSFNLLHLPLPISSVHTA